MLTQIHNFTCSKQSIQIFVNLTQDEYVRK